MNEIEIYEVKEQGTQANWKKIRRNVIVLRKKRDEAPSAGFCFIKYVRAANKSHNVPNLRKIRFVLFALDFNFFFFVAILYFNNFCLFAGAELPIEVTLFDCWTV